MREIKIWYSYKQAIADLSFRNDAHVVCASGHRFELMLPSNWRKRSPNLLAYLLSGNPRHRA